MLSLNLLLATKPLVSYRPHLTFSPWERGEMAGPLSSGPVLQFVFRGSALHATAVARGDEVTLAAVVVAVAEEGLVQNFLEGVGPGEDCDDGGPDVGRGAWWDRMCWDMVWWS